MNVDFLLHFISANILNLNLSLSLSLSLSFMLVNMNSNQTCHARLVFNLDWFDR